MRAAAVYIVVLMLPLAFAALVWPARRIWAVRLVELLTSLILSKFVIVAVLSLAGAAFTTGTPGIGELLVAMSLILLSTFAPWALMRILPFTELAAGAAGMLRHELPMANARATASAGHASGAAELAMELPARLRNQARTYAGGSGGGDGSPEPAPASARAAASEPAPRTSPEPAASAASPMSSGATLSSNGHSAGGGVPGSDGSREDSPPPYVPPPAWQGGAPIRLDSDLLRPSAPEQPTAPDGETKDHQPPRSSDER
jgi:hypothetical protein